jgi:hypothetical protein
MFSILTNIYVHEIYTLQRPFSHIYVGVCALYICGLQLCSPQGIVGTVGGTTIILCATSDTVVVAADSRVIDENDRPVNTVICKIRQLDDSTFFTMAGTVGNTIMNIDLMEQITNYSRTPQFEPLRQKATRVAKAIQTIFLPKIVLKSDSAKAIGTLLFFGRENDSLKAMLRRFFWKNAFTEIINEPMDYESFRAIPMRVLLCAEETDRHVRNAILPFPLILRAEAIADSSIVYDPRKTGRPFDIVCVTRTSYEWIARKQQCQDKE